MYVIDSAKNQPYVCDYSGENTLNCCHVYCIWYFFYTCLYVATIHALLPMVTYYQQYVD